MKFLARLEKSKHLWLLLVLCLAFFFLRIPSVIEPYWYGDEGIYEVVGQAMNHGHLLYRDIWDNKPPLLYVVYAFASGDQQTVKTFSLIIGLITIVAFYFLSQKLLNKHKVSLTITTLFVLLFATPFLEANIANAEDFILLPIILAGLLIYQITIKQKNSSTYYLVPSPLLAGLLLGVAFLFKIVAIFDLAAFLIYFIITNLPEKFSWSVLKKPHEFDLRIRNYELLTKTLLPTLGYVLCGFLIPFLITVLYFASNHALGIFFQSVFSENVDYVAWQNTFFGLSLGLLVLKLALLIGAIVLIIKTRKHFSRPALFITLWLIFSIFNVFFSGRPYTHYSLVLLPSFCLFVGLFFVAQKTQTKGKIFATIFLLVIILWLQFHFSLSRSLAYYQNVLQFISNQKNVEAYQSFFDPKTPRDYTVAAFIQDNTTQKDSVFIWGNDPQIYALSQKLPLGKYVVMYHILQNNAFAETQMVINKKNPKYIIVLKESEPLPFVIPLYIMRYNIPGATIYERSL